MASHADMLDQAEPLFKPFWGSLFLHISVAAALVAYGFLGKRSLVQWGDPGGGGMGAVAVSVSHTIPLPPRSGAENPVANDTESRVPEAPAKAKAQPKVKTPPPDAIPIKSRSARRPTERASSQPNKWREQQKDLPNQNYSTVGQAAVSPLYRIAGGGGVGIGTDSPLGTQFGWYATLLRNKVAENWKTGDVDARLQSAPGVVVTFTLLRDGSLAPGSVRVTQSSGNRALDFSAQRAVLDSAPFSKLPDQFNQNQANIELRFELKR